MNKKITSKIIKMVTLSCVSLVTAFSCAEKEVSHYMETGIINTAVHMASMIDSSNGIGIGLSGLLLHTQDGGKTWNTAEKKTACLFAMDYLGDNKCVAGGNSGGLIKTEDCGKNWVCYPKIPVVRVKGVSFKSFDKGWICSKTAIHETLDEGKTWKVIKNPKGVSVIESIYMVDQSHGFVCSSEGVVYETYDAGESWTQRAQVFDKNGTGFKIKQNQSMFQVAMTFKEGIGYIECVGSNEKGNALKTFKSLDNGATWNEVSTTQLSKMPVAVNICMSDLISITNSDSTNSVYKFN